MILGAGILSYTNLSPIQHAQLLDKSAHDLVNDLNMGQYILINELLSQVRARARESREEVKKR